MFAIREQDVDRKDREKDPGKLLHKILKGPVTANMQTVKISRPVGEKNEMKMQ